MAEYIDRDALVAKFDRMGLGEHSFIEKVFSDGVRTIIAEMPAADVVPVVRCKDCVHWREAVTNDKGFLICPASGMEITESDFCSYGEREENNGVD